MTLEPTLNEELRIEDGKYRYQLRSVYTKNGLLHIKFETQYKVHRGTYKLKRLMINPETGREYFYEDIEQAVKKICDLKNNNKQYVNTVSDKIDEVFVINETNN